MRRIRALACLASILIMHPVSAWAGTSASTSAVVAAGELAESQSFDLVVSGAVREQCALGNVPDMDFGNLERPGLGIETKVAFYCNIPFTMTLTGARGALAHTSMPDGQGPYAGELPYSIGVEMPLRHPNRRTVHNTFNSRQLQSGAVIASNGGIATDGMVLEVALGAPSSTAGLLAGEYTETITITVSPL